MKTTSLFLTLSILLFCLAGCQTDTPNPVQTTTTDYIPETTVPETTEQISVAPVLENLYSISVPVTTETGYADDDTVIFNYRYQTMHLIHPDRDVADKIIIDFLSRIEDTRENAEQLYEIAKSKDHASTEFSPYEYHIYYNPTRIDQGVLSLHGYIFQANDSAHSNVQHISASYDMVTGDPMTLGSILYRADVKDRLCEIVISLLEQKTEIDLYDDFQDTVKLRFRKDESQDEDFYFTAQGLNFYFSPYELAPYSAGTVTVEIPYYQLTGIIGDAYFPAEQNYSNGVLEVCKFENADLERFSQFAEIIVDPGSTKLFLTTPTAVQNIQIKSLTWESGHAAPVDPITIFAANILTSHEAILLDAEFYDGKPTFTVSYSIDGDDYHFYLVKEATTDEIVLTERY